MNDSIIKQTPLSIIQADMSSLHNAKLVIDMNNNTTVKKEVPTSDGTSVEQHLYARKEFEELATAYGFDAGRKYEHYRQTLHEPLRTQWDAIAMAGNKDDQAWTADQDELMGMIAPDDAYEKYEDYLSVVKKPRKMKPSLLANRLRVLNLYSANLPSGQGPVTPMNNRRLLITYFRMMPTMYQHQFKRAGRSLATETLHGLSTYFDTLASLEPTEPRKKLNGQQNHKKGKERGAYKGRKTYDKERNHGGGKGKGKGCPEHPHADHSWADCAQNPKSHNYMNPKFLPKDQRRQMQTHFQQQQQSNYAQGQQANTANGGQQSHHVDTNTTNSTASAGSSLSSASQGNAPPASFYAGAYGQLPPPPRNP